MRTDLLDKLAAAKLWLVSETATARPDAPPGLAYLAHALYALVPVLSREVATMQVDEHWRLYVDPDWLAGADTPTVARELAHLTWHLLLEHADRARDQHVDAATAKPWHDAADLTIRHTLGEPLAAHLTDAIASRLPARRSAEEYFAMLSRLPPSNAESANTEYVPDTGGCGSGCDGRHRSHELPPDADAAIEPEEARQIRRRVAIDYREHCTSRGTDPGDALRWARDILEPTIPWESMLARAVRRAAGWAHGHAEYTYRRPSRRSAAVSGVVLPATRRPIPSVAMVVDTSGSVDDHLLGRALGEVDGALRALGIGEQSVTVLACDAAAAHARTVRRARDVRLEGGGGTDMRIGIAAAAALRPPPDLVVVLTDGYTPWPHQPPPGCAVVAAILGRERRHLPPTPAYAARVECLLH